MEEISDYLLRLAEHGSSILESVSALALALPLALPPGLVAASSAPAVCLGVAAATVPAAICLVRKCCKGPAVDREDQSMALHFAHYYAGAAPEQNCTNKCIAVLKDNAHLVNQPLPGGHLLSHGYTPFLRACWNNNFELIHFMLKCGADIRRTNSDGEGPLYLVAYRVSKNVNKWDPRALNLLWDAGCSVDDVNVQNNSIMHLAAKEGNATLARWLILHGAATQIVNAYGYTPRALALSKGLSRSRSSHKVVADLLAPNTHPHKRIFAVEDGHGVHVLERSDTEPIIID